MTIYLCSILDPGETPDIRGVTRCVLCISDTELARLKLTVVPNSFPAHEQVNSGSKIPTIIYYDGDGEVRAVGSEAMKEDIVRQAKEEGWYKAEWCVTIPRC